MSNLLKKTTTAVAGLAIAMTIVGPSAGANAAYDSVAAANKLAQNGVIVDQSNNPSAYRLGDTITRREQVKVAMNLATCKGIVVSDSCEGKSYEDVNSNDWGCKYIETALKNGIVSPNKNFYPNRNISKAEALKMIMNSTGVVKGENSVWEAAYVEGATKAKILDAGFTDYSSAATRGWIFQTAAAALDVCKGNVTDTVIDDTITDETKDDVKKDDTKTDTTVAGGTVKVTLSPENPQSVYVPVEVPRVKMLAFDVTAGDKDVRLNTASLLQVGPGDRTNLKSLAIYNANNQKVSNTRNFGTEKLEINFNRDIVVKAGERASFYVAGEVDKVGTTMYQLRLANLSTSANEVTGNNITGPLMAPITVSNSGLLEFRSDSNSTSSKIEVGKEYVLAAFTLREWNRNEDVILKSFTLEQTESISPEDIQDLVLYADGKEIVNGLKIGNDDRLVINKDIVIPSGKSVRFQIRGKATGGVNEKIQFKLDGGDDIYAVGATTGYTIGFKNKLDSKTELSRIGTVEGSEINAVFTKTDKDQVKPDTSNFVAGTWKLTANSADYTIKRLEVRAKDNAQIWDLISNLRLGNYAPEGEPKGGVYTFKDIYLTKGQTLELPLEMDIKYLKQEQLNNPDFKKNIELSIHIMELDDETNRNVDYKGVKLDKLLSNNNNSSTRLISIAQANVTINGVMLNKNSVVAGNGVEVVGYKAKLNAWDADSVELDTVKFNSTYGKLNEQISGATLLIGSQSYNSSTINDASGSDKGGIEFSNLFHKIDAGVDNVEMTLVLSLKPNIDEKNISLYLSGSDSITVRNSDGEKIDSSNVHLNVSKDSAVIEIIDKGDVRITPNSVKDDTFDKVVLAGTNNVVLANLDMYASNEDMKVNELIFGFTWRSNAKWEGGELADFSSALSNVRLVSKKDGKVIASGASVTNSAIKFNNSFVLNTSDKTMEVQLVADIASIDNTGGTVKFDGGQITVDSVGYKALGLSSSEPKNQAQTDFVDDNKKTIKVVMAKIIPSIEQNLSTGTAKIKFTIDSGNNRGSQGKTPSVTIDKLIFTNNGNDAGEDAYTVKDSDDKSAGVEVTKDKVTVTLSEVENTFNNSITYTISTNKAEGKTYSLNLDEMNYTYVNNEKTDEIPYDLDPNLNIGTTIRY